MHVLLIKPINYQGSIYINKVNEVFSYLTYEKAIRTVEKMETLAYKLVSSCRLSHTRTSFASWPCLFRWVLLS